MDIHLACVPVYQLVCVHVWFIACLYFCCPSVRLFVSVCLFLCLSVYLLKDTPYLVSTKILAADET